MFWEHHFSVCKIHWHCNIVGLLHHRFWLYLVLALFGITSHILNYFLWLRNTDEVSVPEMRIWSILLIKSDLEWCIHSRRLFLNFYIQNSPYFQPKILDFTFSLYITQKKFRIICAYFFVLLNSNSCSLHIKLKFSNDIFYITISSFCEKQLIPNGAALIVQKPLLWPKNTRFC